MLKRKHFDRNNKILIPKKAILNLKMEISSNIFQFRTLN